MKIILFIFSILPFLAAAQKVTTKKSPNNQFSIQESVYKAAVSRQDFEVATSALYYMLELEPGLTDLKDSLCITYFKRRLFFQSNLLAEEILRINPDNVQALEIAAMSQEELADYLEALNRFEFLYTKKKELYILYKIASLQYYLKRIGECESNISRIIADPKSRQQTVSITSSGKTPVKQLVPVAAAAYNISGVILLEMNKRDEARAQFEKSLEIMPDFQMAKNNLNYLTEIKNQGN
jgi:tetratricopeptide (TPR) repeat protein